MTKAVTQKQLPVPTGEDWKAWGSMLVALLQQELNNSGTQTIYDNAGRVIITPAGLYAYNAAGGTPVAPDIVQIDTADLVDNAVITSKLDNLAVDSGKLADLAVIAAKVATGAISYNKHLYVGGISEITITTPGTGYAIDEVLTFTGGGGVDAAGHITQVSAAGAIEAVSITNQGSDYTSAPTVGVTTSGGSGAVLVASVANYIAVNALAVGAAAIAAGAIGTAHIGKAVIREALIADLAVVTAKIADLAVNSAKIANLAVGTAHIQDLAVTNAKINDLAANKITAGTIAAALIMTGKLTLGSAIFGNSGIQLDYNSGNPRLYAGDGNDKFIQFDTSSGEVTIGRDTDFYGADSYNNTKVGYYHLFPHNVTGTSVIGGGGTVTQRESYLDLDLPGSVVASALFRHGIILAEIASTWDKKRYWKSRITCINISNTGDREYIFGMGIWNDASSTSRCAAVHLDQGTYYGRVCNGTTCTTTTFSVSETGNKTHVFEIIFYPASKVEFYLDGVLKVTITTNLPTGTANADLLGCYSLHDNAVVANAPSINIAELKFLQEA